MTEAPQHRRASSVLSYSALRRRTPRARASLSADQEPDYRFTLANERTFLAWMRTALALIAGGVAAREFIDSLEPVVLRGPLAVTCLATAALIGGGAFLHWFRVQQAMRRAQPLPNSWLLPVLAGGVFLAASLCMWGMLT